MKSWLLASIMLMSCAGYSGQETHGGNGFAAEFFAIFDSFLVNPHSSDCLSKISSQEIYVPLVLLRHELLVKSEATLSLDGETVGAINYPQRRPRLVVLSEEKWKNSDDEQKQALVIHEVLHLVGLNDKTYYYSSQVLNCLKQYAPMKSSNEVKNIFTRCLESEISTLTDPEISNTFRAGDPYWKWFYSGVLIASQCVEGLNRLKEENLFECGPLCIERACEFADNRYPGSDPVSTLNQNLKFLEFILKEFKHDVDLNSCNWKICENLSLVFYSQHPRVKNTCLTKTNKLP